jgi:DNA-binding SARP family transcriptional activator
MPAATSDLPRHHVGRPRLLAAFDGAPVASVVAGGGYGKTTLAIALGRARGVATPVARIASQGGDAASLVWRLQTAFRERGLSDAVDALEDGGDPRAAIDRLVEALAVSPDPTVIVVDEADRLDDEDCALLGCLARERPPGVQLVTTGRTLPPPLAAALTDAMLLGQPELAFTVEETAAVLERSGVRDPDTWASRLCTLVGGWPLAVSLAASRLAHARDVEAELVRMETAPVLVSGLVDSALAVLTPADGQAVRQLALLPRLTLEVAERAAGSVGIVDRAVAAGIPMHLAADSHLAMPDPVRESLALRGQLDPAVAGRVAEAYIERGTGVEAVRVLLTAAQAEQAAAAAEALTPQELSRLDVRELSALLSAIPDDALDRHPRALLHLARACEASAERDLRSRLVERVRALAVSDPAIGREVEAEIARDLVRDGRVGEAAALAETLLAAAGVDELHTRVRALHVLGRTYAWRGEPGGLAAAEPLLEEAADLYGRLGYQTARAHALLALAYDVQTLGGRFAAAVDTLETALAGLQGRSRLRGVVLVFQGEALIDLGRLAEAEARFAEAESLGHLFGDTRTLGYVAWLRARAAASLGDAARVVAQLAEAERRRGPWFDHHTGAEFLAEAALLLDQVGEDDLARGYLARAVAREAEAPRYVLLAAATIEARSGDPVRAGQLLGDVAVLPGLEVRETWRVALLRGWAASRAGDGVRAALHAREAFALAEATEAPDLPMRREPAIAAALLPLSNGSASGAIDAGPPALVTLLGGFGVQRAGTPVMLPAGRPEALVKLLALRGGRLPAEEAIERLWPGVGAVSGRKRLRNVLSRLRDGAGRLVLRDGDVLALPSGTEIDAVVFEQAARAAAAEPDPEAAVERARVALALYVGEALPDDRYADWAAEPRERLRARALAVLDLLVTAAEREGAIDEALRLLERGIELDRLDESRYLRAAGLLLRQGKRGRAIDILRAAAAAVRELGLEPSAEHRELVRATRD